MKSVLGFVPCALAAIGLVGFAGVFMSETETFRKSLATWAERDLASRATLAAETLRAPLATGDFRRLRDFGEGCRADGVRLTVFVRPCGVLYDSQNAAGSAPVKRPEVACAFARGEGTALRRSTTLGEEFLYAARAGGDFAVRLAIPASRVFAPLDRARTGFLLAGITGACGILLAFLFWGRLLSRVRKLALERDANEKLLAEMKRVENFRRDFIANVSHEIRTPLTGILGAADLLSDGGDALPSADRSRLLGMLRGEATRLNSLAEEVLALARLERDEASLDLVDADLADVVRETADRFRDEAGAAGVEISTHLPDEPLLAKCDASLVEQALANLVRNALLHAKARHVDVSAAKEDSGRVVLSVSDDGAGIAPEHQARLFERFYRVDAARDGATGGSGLGLAIVRQIARLHGGDATVESAPGRGARFSIAIPAAL